MNIGELFREFNQHKDLFQSEKNLEENISCFTNQNLEKYKEIVNDEKIILEKLQVFLQQQFKKHGKSSTSVKQQKEHTEDRKEPSTITETTNHNSVVVENEDHSEPDNNDPSKIPLNNGIFLEIQDKKRILHFPTYKVIY